MSEFTSRNGHDGATRREIKRLLVEGLPNKVIARRVGVELGTVKHHVGHIIRETRARNRTQAAVALVRAELRR